MRTQSALAGDDASHCSAAGTAGGRRSAFYPATLQAPDGAMTLNSGGNYVEPYFATKALIVAQDGGLDVREAAKAWIEWVLPRQRPDGLFRRFCRVNGEWRDCAPADADDSMLALWMQLLYRMAPATGMPAEWQRSLALSARQLAKLRNQRLGVYHISTRNHVALLMDNIEVYAALKDVARAQLRLHDPAASPPTLKPSISRPRSSASSGTVAPDAFVLRCRRIVPPFIPTALPRFIPGWRT